MAKSVKGRRSHHARGGVQAPHLPYDFQGLKADGIELLLEAKRGDRPAHRHRDHERQPPAPFEDVDVIQVGARNMQNFELLKELGKTRKPILLKRGLANTIKELLMSAEYIMASGNENVILCERGIRTFETATRNTLDLSAVSVLHELTHLPVIVDPSHATAWPAMSSPWLWPRRPAGGRTDYRGIITIPTPCATGPSPCGPEQFEMWPGRSAVCGRRRWPTIDGRRRWI